MEQFDSQEIDGEPSPSYSQTVPDLGKPPELPSFHSSASSILAQIDVQVRWITYDSKVLELELSRTKAATLHKDLKSKTKRIGIAPKEVQEDLLQNLAYNSRSSRYDFMFTSNTGKTVLGETEASVHGARAKYEFEELLEIVHTARKYQILDHSEPAWNTCVHVPILRIALRGCRDVILEDVTQASITDLSRSRSGELLQESSPKMINFTLNLHPTRYSDLHLALELFVDNLRLRSFNSSTYEPLCASPIGVVIETNVKAGSIFETGIQLGVWLAAWFRRVRDFSQETTFVPAIIVNGPRWELWFAFDKGNHINLYGKMDIGGTEDMLSIYVLLSTLKILANWVATDFQTWVKLCIRFVENIENESS